MKRWWQDTLFKRLFLLIWGCLIVSHFVAFFVVTLTAVPILLAYRLTQQDERHIA